MEDGAARIQRMQQQVIETIKAEVQRWMDDLLADAFNPASFLRFVVSMGIDLSQLPGMVGQQTGFDPYRILGLDKSASDEEVKKRYRQFLMKLHPDTAGVQGTDFLLQMILAAYKQISTERGWQ